MNDYDFISFVRQLFFAHPFRLFRPVGFLLCGWLFLSAGAYADDKKSLFGSENSVLISAGKFTMGSNDGDDNGKPVHEVVLNAFRLDTYEVAVA